MWAWLPHDVHITKITDQNSRMAKYERYQLVGWSKIHGFQKEISHQTSIMPIPFLSSSPFLFPSARTTSHCWAKFQLIPILSIATFFIIK